MENDPSELAMRVHAFADELDAGLKDEIAFRPVPQEMKFIPGAPHVSAGGADGVFLRSGVIGGRAGQFGRTHIAVGVELAERGGLQRGRHNPD